MKKSALIALLLALAMTLSLAACGGESTEDSKEGTTPAESMEAGADGDQKNASDGEDALDEVGTETEQEDQNSPEELPGEETDAQEPQSPAGAADSSQSEKPVQKPVSKPSEDSSAQKPASKPGEGSTTQKPEDNGATPPDTSAQPEQPESSQGESDSGDVDLQAFYDGLISQGEWPAMGAQTGEALEAFYPGLTAIDTKQCVVQMAMITMAGAEFVLVEVSDSADVQAVKDIFQSRIDYQVGDGESPGGAWYPGPTEMWKNESRIVSEGNYVMLAVCEGVDDVVAAFSALFEA